MNNLRVLIFSIIALAITAAHSSEAWVPEVKFQLEDADYIHTLTWVSGFGYALNAIGKMPDGQNHKRRFCTPINGYIGSKEILEILNDKFEGQTITSEQATAEIIEKIPGKYPCE